MSMYNFKLHNSLASITLKMITVISDSDNVLYERECNFPKEFEGSYQTNIAFSKEGLNIWSIEVDYIEGEPVFKSLTNGHKEKADIFIIHKYDKGPNGSFEKLTICERFL